MRRSLTMLLAAGMLGACASAGGFPKTQDSGPAIATAERAINEAVSAGADTLAAGIMKDARMHLDAARAEASVRKPAQAELHAREATADARYARSVARQLTAERSQSDAQAALAALPPQGDDR
ncbi:MAG TPA: DUF4398 domain-containing protein [Gemmatimonadaceae bacterium]|nr:DUF4398 domain-containing protein [Gemmatimonadaceae bacterium]